MAAVELAEIVKRYGALAANDGASMSVARGEIHALVGENGAGKSTLMHILYGLIPPDSGTIAVDGSPARFRSPADALALGIGMVHQHFMLVPPLTAAENIVLGREPRGGPLLDLDRARRSVAELAREYRLDVDPDAPVASLSVGLQQRVEILKLLYREASILILDEPTPVLTPQEVDELFATLRNLRSAGRTVILITHKLAEVMAIADTVTVMRRGKVVESRPTSSTNETALARAMVGGDIPAAPRPAAARPAGGGLAVRGLEAVNDRGLAAVRGVTLDAARGEILGIAAVEGNGQTELVQAVTGLRRPAAGTILVDGAPPRKGSIAHIPEDRLRRGLVEAFTLRENLLLGRQQEFAPRGIFAERRIREYASATLERFDVRPPDPGRRAGTLSGGNQQKVVIGRELAKDAAVIVAAQPTRGLDIGAIAFVHRTLLEERGRGKAILLVSSDLDELLALADRIAVMYEGKVVFTAATRSVTQRELGAWMTGAARA